MKHGMAFFLDLYLGDDGCGEYDGTSGNLRGESRW
jgi:hypothetical protein